MPLPGLFIPTSGLYFSVPGSQLFTNSGSLLVPVYHILMVTVRAPGGGGGPGCGYNNYDQQFVPGNYGGNATESRFASATPVVANPGLGGAPGYSYTPYPSSGRGVVFYNGAAGDHGSGSGGVVTVGGGGPGGVGGSGPYGGAYGSAGGPGGWGGRVVKSWNRGEAEAPTPNSLITITVGVVGVGGTNPAGSGPNGGATGADGSPGLILVEWS